MGDFSSLSATTDVQYPTAELVDASGKPTGETITQTGPTQVAVTGKLRNGAVVSLHWRGGLETKAGKDGTPFIWVIDGEKGSIRLESDDAGGSFIHVRPFPTMYLNGEEVKFDADEVPNPAKAWAEFAKRSGNHATIDDAVRVKRVVDAIKRSARDGKLIHL